VKFSIFDHMERRNDCDLTQLYEDRLQLMALADAVGIHSYHIAEHHHSPLCSAPNQSVFLAAAAQRTKRIGLGTLVYVLPLYHPVRLIEEICLVDRLSNGRVQVGVGRGSGGGYEVGMWGRSEDPANLFREHLDIVLQGLQSEFLTYRGKYHTLEHLWMELRPVQRPLPAFWYAGNAEHAGQYGMNFIGHGTISSTKPLIDTYKRAFEAGRANPGKLHVPNESPLYGTVRRIFVADTDAEARDRAEAAYEVYRTRYAKPLPPGVPWTPKYGRAADPRQLPGHTAHATPREAMATEELLVGSPSTIRDYVLRYDAQSGANLFVGAYQWGDLTHAEASKSLGLFGREVMPAIA
jgi:alkanesulfonate monooxygenase SsuD/methylene tetrahydromethanopterin reductase-like flavin-dependent oxidoreductase (luciferase family)